MGFQLKLNEVFMCFGYFSHNLQKKQLNIGAKHQI